MKSALEYLKIANTPTTGKPVSIHIVTNFTDASLVKIFTGVLHDEGISPEITSAAYKQYHLELKGTPKETDISFFFFDTNNYVHSAFHESSHFDEVLADVAHYCEAQKGPVIFALFPLPYQSAYGNLAHESALFAEVTRANTHARTLAEKIPNLYTCDTSRVLHNIGEKNARDFRGLYSADIPFSNDFFVELAHEWAALVRVHVGLIKKCLVLDLDNTLWGGIVGETDPLGIELGPDYPGVAYQNFQRALLELFNRGIILAINSKNNQADVDEVFATNPHMILKPEHFAAVRANWQDKAQNMRELAEELNIGLDSMVFLDDDAMNRDLVRTMLPEVAVPDWSLPPEEYAPTLLSFTYFHQFALTAEDKEKGKMYSQERQRKVVEQSSQSLEDYIKALDIKVTTHLNDESQITRAAQMTQKTNQFNLTTKRYGEKEILEFMKSGWVMTADVSDKFGSYGTTILAIIVPTGTTNAHMDTYLMSCRILGRGVEARFMEEVYKILKEKGIERLEAEFIQTPKNDPAKDFLDRMAFVKEDTRYYKDLT